jgi:hypothetical protein
MPVFPFALPLKRRLGRSLLLGLVVLGLGVQGLSQAVERVAAPAHRHAPRSAAEAPRLATVADEARPYARDDHRRIPWIGEGAPDGAAAAAAHAHDGVAGHRHALADEGVVYVDAEEDVSGSGSKPATATACPLQPTPPRVACGRAGGHAAWRAGRGWHALAMTGEPLDRPPR